jgi:hypothetical protein
VLNWTAPTRNVDGTALTNLAGYDIQYRKAGTTGWPFKKTIANPGATTATIWNLAPGTWVFCMKSFNNVGVRSACTGTVKVTLS